MVSPTATRVPACGETERSVTKSKENKEGRPAELGWAARTNGKRPRPAAERPPPHSPWPRPPRNARRRAERAGAAARRKARHCTTAAVRRGGAARFVVERFCAPWANCADVPERIWRHRSVLWKCSLLSQPCPVSLLCFFAPCSSPHTSPQIRHASPLRGLPCAACSPVRSHMAALRYFIAEDCYKVRENYSCGTCVGMLSIAQCLRSYCVGPRWCGMAAGLNLPPVLLTRGCRVMDGSLTKWCLEWKRV